MIKNRKIEIKISFLVLLLFLVYGCGQRDSGREGGLATGTDGITLNFLENNPQDSYLVSEDEEQISIILEVRNKGSFPRENDDNILSRGQVFISGFDSNIIDMEDTSQRLNREFLMGISNINPEGGFDTIEFEGFIFPDNLIVDKYEPTILATLCYPYVTKAGPTVCIDPFPFDEKQEKVCNIGSKKLSSQGAPIAITAIEQEASSSKIQFKISLENAGGGDIIKLNALESCNPSAGTLERGDFDRIVLTKATVGFTELRCGPFDGGGNIVRLNNGKGFIICSLDRDSYEDSNSAYTTPLNLEFRYGYRITTSKPIKISKITSIS